MSLTRSSPRRWACPAAALCALGLLGAAALGEEGKRPAAKRDAKKVAKMVDALANRNKPPKVVRRPQGIPAKVAVYPEGYDWKEERRVRRALGELYADTSVELWEELVRRADDERYCVVVVDCDEWPDIRSVGDVCRDLAYDRLVDVFDRHLPGNPDRADRPLRLPVSFAQVNLAEWRKERAKKSLYELQVEACQEAVRALAKVKGLSKEEGAEAREKIEAEVAKLRRAKRPHLRKFSFNETTYDPEVAKRVRKAVQSGSREWISIIR